MEIGIGDILTFFTGAPYIPPLGLDDATLNFNSDNPYPTASTCGLTLTLPSRFDSYAAFKDSFVFAMLNHGGLVFIDPLFL